MALASISELKAREEGYQPLLLVELSWSARQFGDAAATYYFAANSIDPVELGVTDPVEIAAIQYEGQTYQGRIMNHQFAAWQAVSAAGIGMSPSLSLEIADPDLEIWTTVQGEDGPGFRGARCLVKFVFFNPETYECSSDALIVFRGTVTQPQSRDNVLYLQISSMLLMQFMTLPSQRIGRRCPWLHPETDAERLQAADPRSAFFECGAKTLGAVVDGVYVDGPPDDGSTCNHTPADCTRLGRLVRDIRGVGRFGGVRYSQDIPREYHGKVYTANKSIKDVNADTSSKYSDYVPLLYGFGWVDCPVTVVNGAANYNRFEAIFCYGDTWELAVPIMGVSDELADGDRWRTADGWFCTINGRSLSRGDGRQIAPQFQGVIGLNGWWDWTTHGGRDGTCSRQDGFVRNPWEGDYARRAPVGDPYGSMSVFTVSVLSEAAQSDALPQIRMLGAGMKLQHAAIEVGSPPRFVNMIVDPDDDTRRQPGVATPWAIWDAMLRGGWFEEELDFDLFAEAAKRCSRFVPYTDAQGNVHDKAHGHPKWKTNLVLRHPQAVSSIIDGLLNNCDAVLVNTDKLGIRLNETLASQQPAVVPWSNDPAPYSSMLVDGTAAQGYFVYVFDETNIKQDERGQSTLDIRELQLEETPNVLSFTFFDEENQYRQDSLSVADERDIHRTGMIVPAGFEPLGVPNYDQGFRGAWRRLARASRGNPRYEPVLTRKIGTSGTWVATWTTSAQAIGIQVGDIAGLRSIRYAIGQGEKPQAFRITEIKATPDFAEFTITAWWHSDLFCRDDYGQQDEDLYSDPGGDALGNPPAPWAPYFTQAPASDPWTPGEWTFGVRQYYQARADGATDAYLKLMGYLPVNRLSSPASSIPHFTEPPYAISGGTLIAGATYYIAVTALDGSVSPPREGAMQHILAKVLIPVDGSKRTIYLPKMTYHGGTGAALYIGLDPLKLANQVYHPSAQDLTFTVSTAKLDSFGPPDLSAYRLLPVFKRTFHSGNWGQPIDVIPAPNQISILEAGWTVNQYADRIVSVLGRAAEAVDQMPLPVWNFHVVSNTVDTLTLDPAVDLGALGVAVNDALVMRAQATAVTADSVTDTGWISSLAEPDPVLTVKGDDATGEIVLRLALNSFVTGDHVRVFGVYQADGAFPPAHEANGNWTVTVLAPEWIRLDGSVFASIAMPATGFVQIRGMRVNEEKGRQLTVIARTGYGQSRRIVANTDDTIWVDPPFLPALSAEAGEQSIFIIEEAGWTEAQPGQPFDNAVSPDDVDHRAAYTLDVPVPNRGGQMIRCGAIMLDQSGRRSASMLTREAWMWGHPGSANLTEKDRATFGIGIGAPQPIADDVTNHFMCRQPDGGGLFIEAIGNCKTPMEATALPLRIGIDRAPLLADGTHGDWVSIFPDDVCLVLPALSAEQHSVTTFRDDNAGIEPGDWLRIDLLAGSNEGSEDIEVVVRWGA